MRASPTPQELMLWLRLRELRSQGYHFRRQAPFCGYFLDFVCFNHRLVVTLRVSNGDVNTNMAGVMDAVFDALATSAPLRR